MNKLVATTLFGVGAFALIQTYLAVAEDASETQKYRVILKEKDFEIRFYPEVTMATITSAATSYRELGRSGFRKLANYIFGGNATKQKIAMTAPVHMEMHDSLSTMSFVMPSMYNEGNLPIPQDSGVMIKTVQEEYVAALTFGGYASDSEIRFQTEELERALKARAISFNGNFRFLGYNAPYQFFNRRNEIIVRVNWSAK
jgi:SOUL heme-binding protein